MLDDSMFSKSLKPVVHIPHYWKSDIGVESPIPRAVDYYLQWKTTSRWRSTCSKYHLEQVAILKDYFQQWLAANCWETADNTALDQLRLMADNIVTMRQLNDLRELLIEAGIDPIE